MAPYIVANLLPGLIHAPYFHRLALIIQILPHDASDLVHTSCRKDGKRHDLGM